MKIVNLSHYRATMKIIKGVRREMKNEEQIRKEWHKVTTEDLIGYETPVELEIVEGGLE